MKTMRIVLVSLASFWLLGCAAEVKNDPDSETNWIECQSTADCPSEMSCLLVSGRRLCGEPLLTGDAGAQGGAPSADASGSGGGPTSGAGGQGGAPTLLIPSVGCEFRDWPPGPLVSNGDLSAAVVGRWVQCGAGAPVNIESPFEFSADGHWYRLTDVGAGAFGRLEGSGETGTYRVDISDPSYPQLVLTTKGYPPQSTLTSNVGITSQPRRMRFGPAPYAPLE